VKTAKSRNVFARSGNIVKNIITISADFIKTKERISSMEWTLF